MSSGGEPLLRAVASGNVREVSRLLQDGASADASDRIGRTALMFAIERSMLAIAVLLLDSGADLEAKSAGGDNALFYAVRARSLDGLRLLLERGADPDSKERHGNPAVLEAVRAPDTCGLLALLLDRGARVDEPGYGGRTAMMEAARLGRADAVRLLLEGGASPSAVDVRGWNVWMFAAADAQVDLLEEMSGSLRVGDRSALNAGLLVAAQKGDLRAVSKLLELGADSGARDTLGRTACDIASQNGFDEVKAFLLRRQSR